MPAQTWVYDITGGAPSGGAGPFVRTYLVKKATVSSDSGDHVYAYGANISQPSVMRRIVAVRRLACGDLTVKFHATKPDGTAFIIATCTLLAADDFQVWTTFTGDTLPDSTRLYPEITAGDDTADANGVVSFTLEWMGRGAAAATAEGITYAGTYDAGSTYALDDIVYDPATGASHISLADANTGHSLSDPAFWGKISSGSVGPAGPAGPTGPAGSPGVGVPTGGTAGQVLSKIDATDYHTQWSGAVALLGITIDGGGSAIVAGQKGYLSVPFSCTITAWDIVADQTGSISIEIDKHAGGIPNTTTDKISASSPIALSSAQLAQGGSISGWTTAVASGDVIGFNVASASTVTRVTATIRATKT